MEMATNSIRAFSDPKYNYYRLTKDFGLLKAGTIFYHDPNDTLYGSLAQGCLKNCWTSDGGCFEGNGISLAGGAVILHYEYVGTDWFEKVECTEENFIAGLKPGQYELEVYADGTYKIIKHGSYTL